jgi:hypothetical protein
VQIACGALRNGTGNAIQCRPTGHIGVPRNSGVRTPQRGIPLVRWHRSYASPAKGEGKERTLAVQELASSHCIECAANIEYDEFLPKSLRGSLHVSSVGLGIRFSRLTITAILVA